MYYRFVKKEVNGQDIEYQHRARKTASINMSELGLKGNRETINQLMEKQNLKEGDIQFWFTEKGLHQVGKHLQISEVLFKWFKLKSISEDLIIFKDELQVATRLLIVGKKNQFTPPPGDYWKAVETATPAIG